MTPEKAKNDPSAADFLAEAGKLATKFGWPAQTLERPGEVVCVAATKSDAAFARFVWVYDTERTALRCLLVGQQTIPAGRRTAIFELCARVNEGLPFGCLEYSFSDKVLVFRDSADLDWAPLRQIVEGVTARVLNLGRRYSSAIKATLDGEMPEDAVATAEADRA
jgi:hypothetical protein